MPRGDVGEVPYCAGGGLNDPRLKVTMSTETTTTPAPVRLGVTETEIAQALGLSVYFLQHDRRKRQLIPFYRIGGSIRYCPDRVREALAALEEGGTKKTKKGGR